MDRSVKMMIETGIINRTTGTVIHKMIGTQDLNLFELHIIRESL